MEYNKQKHLNKSHMRALHAKMTHAVSYARADLGKDDDVLRMYLSFIYGSSIKDFGKFDFYCACTP